jgi:hypothetical protein
MTNPSQFQIRRAPILCVGKFHGYLGLVVSIVTPGTYAPSGRMDSQKRRSPNTPNRHSDDAASNGVEKERATFWVVGVYLVRVTIGFESCWGSPVLLDNVRILQSERQIQNQELGSE